MKTCETCQHWAEGYNNDQKGICFRYPPIPYHTNNGNVLRSMRPETTLGDWCGEHKERVDG